MSFEAWSELALDALWYEVDDLEILLKPFGQIVVTSRNIKVENATSYSYDPWRIITETTYELQSLPSHSQWLRFQQLYAPRVRILRLKVEDPHKAQSLVNLLSQIRSFEPLLPNLRTVKWNRLFAKGLREPVFAFTHERIQQFDLTDTGEYSLGKYIACEAIVTRMPNLTKLALNIEPDVKYVPALINMIKGLKSLQLLTIPPFFDMSSIIVFLSVLQGLKELRIFSPQNGRVVKTLKYHRDAASVYFPVLESLTIFCNYETTSALFCHEIPHLKHIHVLTPIRERPIHVQGLLAKISNTCPRVTQISLGIKYGTIHAQEVKQSFSPDCLVTLETISPILRSSISSFRIQHPLPLDFGLNDIDVIASSWPRLKILNLGCDPLAVQQPTIHKLGLQAIFPFIRHCPDMEELGLFIDAKSSDIPLTVEIDALPKPFARLRILSFGMSDIGHENVIAQFLSFICNQGCVVQHGTSWYQATSPQDSAKRWGDVNTLLKHLLVVRAWYERKLSSEVRKLQIKK
ncbi:hypothetical protein VKT23_012017 [Stygiomarasmius scandens]|uniref:F-box domain-containing protein n=1 Tax=Marasmiellus scandens TaxID=2682957 RepID=A0ABR1JA58_9AGAR